VAGGSHGSRAPYVATPGAALEPPKLFLWLEIRQWRFIGNRLPGLFVPIKIRPGAYTFIDLYGL
jgi:hypothetical protein